jgi:hypothetical protein
MKSTGEVSYPPAVFERVRAVGLLRPRAVYAHCIHIDDNDRALRDTSTAAAVSPTSNLGSGFFDYVKRRPTDFVRPGHDVGGGRPSARFTPCCRLLRWAEGIKPAYPSVPQAVVATHGWCRARAGLTGVVVTCCPQADLYHQPASHRCWRAAKPTTWTSCCSHRSSSGDERD